MFRNAAEESVSLLRAETSSVRFASTFSIGEGYFARLMSLHKDKQLYSCIKEPSPLGKVDLPKAKTDEVPRRSGMGV